MKVHEMNSSQKNADAFTKKYLLQYQQQSTRERGLSVQFPFQ